MRKKIKGLSLFLAISLSTYAQDSPVKFGKVSANDFKNTVYSLDTNASAVIIADIGSTKFEGNNTGDFSLVFKNFRRAHILNKNGYGLAEVEIALYTDGSDEEELEGLKAVTYNLENGEVVQSKLDVKTSVFKDKKNKNWVVRKFTFPNLKVGSIIEYEYRIKSEYTFNLRSWEFQGGYPRLWSEYNVAIPEFYKYVTLSQGYLTAFIKNEKSSRSNFTWMDTRGAGSSERATFSANVTDYRWVMKDVPALKKEEFTSTLDNHISKIEFQLAALQQPYIPKTIMSSWSVVSKALMTNEDFGAQLKKDNGWLNDIMTEATKMAPGKLERAKNIYAWVRDNYTCTSLSGKYLQQSLKNILKNRNGNVSEINLLLTAILLKADIDADPVLLSTRSHGYAHTIYPLIDRLNYVIVRAVIDGNPYFLDATHPGMGFGKLDYECYNGQARVIDKEATSLEFSADSLKETSITTVFIINDEKGNSIGSLQKLPGYYESYHLRNRFKESGKEGLIKDFQKDMGSEIEISNVKIDSLQKYEEPLGIGYDFNFKGEKPDIIYMNPMFGEAYKENPFKSAERAYPIEMPYTKDEIFTFQMEIPKDYLVDELPKPILVKLNEQGDGVFEYRISTSGNSVLLRSRLTFKRTWYDPAEYELLREFFGMVVQKHNEQIVFKKK
ncbi:MAG TPA: transglutaminase domain-containing protein [Chitinophagaceae bacterium]|nr:transglutaminase domain-containing protein [Chitinophagaceae bacterium]